MHGDSPLAYLSDPFLDRVRRAYRFALEATSYDKGPVWQPIDDRRADVHAALLKAENDCIRGIFADPITTDLFYGTDGICRSIFGQLQNDDSFRSHVDKFARDSLSRLASELKLKIDGHEQIIEQLDHLLRQRVAFPAPFSGEIALQTSRGRVGERAIYAVYETSRLINLLQNSPSKDVIEIGPGVGRTAYYGHRSGLNYTTVDLPLGIVAQACFLGATIGPDALWFESDEHLSSKGRVKILSRLPDVRFDVVLNADSLTEMPPGAAFVYARWITRHARQFLSVNHNKNTFTVSEVMAFAGGSNRTERVPSVIWPSYVEELFSCDGPASFRPIRWRAFRMLLDTRALRRRMTAARVN